MPRLAAQDRFRYACESLGLPRSLAGHPGARLGVALTLIVLSTLGCGWGSPGYLRSVQVFAPAVGLLQIAELPQAATRLSAAVTLGFIAPEPCARQLSTQPQRSAHLQLECAEFMAEVETRAIQHGFAVHSWRSWPAQGDRLAAAQLAGVDLIVDLHEVGETLQPNQVLVGKHTQFSLLMVAPGQLERPLRIRNPVEVAARCQARFQALAAKAIPSTTLVADVRDGRTGAPLWQLRRQFSSFEGLNGVYRAEHGVRVRPRVTFPSTMGWSYLMVGTFAALGGWFTDEKHLTAMGLGLAVGSLAAVVLAPPRAEAWPEAEPLVCAEGDAHWLAAAWAPSGQLPPLARQFAVELLQRLAGGQRAAGQP